MASSSNFDLKEKLSFNFKDTAAINSLCGDIAIEIESGSMKFDTFIETLGSYMTDQDVVTRKKGVTILSSVMSQLSKDYLNESELHYITRFYCNRIEDHYDIIPSVLNGILAIINMTHLPRNAPSFLLKAIFDHIPCQSHLLPERHSIYIIFESLIENKLEDLKCMGPDLVYGIISSIDGERDPKNLILLFNILPYFMKEIPLGHLSEEMFEVLACYFPVDFNPSGVEIGNLKVTRKNLAEKLAPCLYAVPEFSDYCIPLIIEKLYSSLKVAKLDSLNLLRDAVKTFKLSKVERHLPELWTILRKEIIPAEDTEIKNAALEAIISLTTIVSINETICKDFIGKIITDTRLSFCDVQNSLHKQNVKMLLEKIAIVNKVICMQVSQIMIPLCIGQYSTSENSLNDKIALLETLNTYIKMNSDHGLYIQDIPELAWTKIIHIYLDDLATAKHIELKSKILFGLTIQKAYLNDSQRSILYDTICSEINTGCDEIQAICHTTILDFATLYLQEILTLVKYKLLLNSGMRTELMKRRIGALLRIATIQELGLLIFPHILALFTNNINTEIRITILTNILKLIVSSEFNIYEFLYNECHIIDEFISCKTCTMDHKILMSNICRVIVRNLPIEKQYRIAMKHTITTAIMDMFSDMPVTLNLLIPLHKDINLNINKESIENLYNLALDCNRDPYIRESSCKCLSIILNKTEDFDWIVAYMEDRINNSMEADIDTELKKYTVNLLIWITKGLATRGCNKAQCFLENLTHLLTHNQIGMYVAEQYHVMVKKNEEILTLENFCNIKTLYKQRVFVYLLEQTINYTGSMRQNYLIALISLLGQIPEELLHQHLVELNRLLIESLSLNNEHLISQALMSLMSQLDAEYSIFFDNVQCAIPRLLRLSTYQNMRIRILALECLTYYADYPTIITNPYKQVVLEKLALTLCDHKRFVRKAAVKARTEWFRVGASEEEKQ